MPDTIRVEGRLLRLNGVALYRKFGIRVLAAGLWLDHPERSAETILSSDTPRRYVTHFYHRVGAERIRKEWRKALKENTPNATEEVDRQILLLGGWVSDFAPGDEIAVNYVPEHGSTVFVNGVRKGVLLGKAFADAYFGCALGPHPHPNGKFKRALLGG